MSGPVEIEPVSEPSASPSSGVSVIVVAYNSALVMPRCLGALSEHLPDAEIVVVDNGSRDNTVALVESRPTVRLVTGHGNVGFGAGVNLGARAASRRLLMVLTRMQWWSTSTARS